MEQWKPVPKWEGLYEVSDQGRVRSVLRQVKGKNGPTTYQSKMLKLCASKNRYPFVALSRSGEKRYAYVHDLVLEAFVGPKLPGFEVCHRDGTRDNNHLHNIRYGTRSENAVERITHGKGPKKGHTAGEKNANALLTAEAVLTIRAASGTLRELGERFGVHLGTIHAVRSRKTWKHI